MKNLFRGIAISLLIATAAGCAGESIEVPVTKQKTLGYASVSSAASNTETRAVELSQDDIKDIAISDATGVPVGMYSATTGVKAYHWNVYYDTASSTWTYNNGVAIGHPNDTFVHYAIWPREFDANLENNGLNDVTSLKGGVAKFEYTVEDTAETQIDLMADVKQTDMANPKTTFNLSHLLSYINFSVVGTAGVNIHVYDIKLVDVANKGVYTFAGKDSDGGWSGQTGTATYDYTPAGSTLCP